MRAVGTVDELRQRLALPPDGDAFSAEEVAGLAEPVRRYLTAAVAEGTPPFRAAHLRIRGEIRLRAKWLAFSSEEVLAPLDGFVWWGRVSGGMTGWDGYADGVGRMRWKLARIIPVASAEGPNVSSSAAGRAGGEGIWLPTALLPRFGVEWSATDTGPLLARFLVGGEVPVHLVVEVDDEGLVRSATFDRIGDPDGTGEFGVHPFGIEVTEHETFAGLTIPSAGEAGWHHGTGRWDEGRFFRYRITALDPIA